MLDVSTHPAEAWAVEAGVVALGVSLASDMWDPNWVVRVNLLVATTDLHRFAVAAERLAYDDRRTSD